MIPYIRETYIIKGIFMILLAINSGIIWKDYYISNTVTKSRFIHVMQKMFFHQMVMFIALSITPILGVVSTDYAVIFSNYLTWPFLLGVYIHQNMFIHEIFNKENDRSSNLPKVVK